MAVVKRITDLTSYTGVLPYDSEMFGVYQPLLGWKSKRTAARFERGLEADQAAAMSKLLRSFAGAVKVDYRSDGRADVQVEKGAPVAGALASFESVVLQQVGARLPDHSAYKPDVWARLINETSIASLLKKDVPKAYSAAFDSLAGREANPAALAVSRTGMTASSRGSVQHRRTLGAFESQLGYESSVAGVLLSLVKSKNFKALENLFYQRVDATATTKALSRILSSTNSVDANLDLETLDPGDREQMRNVVLSPISVVHLFRQYFFELDTFLGTPVSHVWLSPGSSVELLEIQTRKTTVEKTLETTLDILTKSETLQTRQDDLSEAVKEDNGRDIKFGASVTASYASISATSSFDYANSQKTSRESAHRQMRQQTEKLSSEIRKNFKSTFKTTTETTDVTSVKHTMANTSNELINYELRRKMRQVGVQVQDIGTFLCWQTYVDDPGRELGMAKLIHIAKPADLDQIPHPEEIPLLQPFQEERIVTVPFISVLNDADNEGEIYVDGVESDDSEFLGSLEKIQPDFPQEFVCPRANYRLASVEFDPQGRPVTASIKGGIVNADSRASFVLHLDSADFEGKNSVQLRLTLHWTPGPGANDTIVQKNKDATAAFQAKEKAEFDKAVIETVKERVEIASRIKTRSADDLREEERIVVYRRLVQEMLQNGIELPDDRTRHVVAEVLNSIFDVDKMLYFVAPEWWRPRLHRSKQQLLETTKTAVFDPSLFSRASTQAVMQRGLLRKVNSAVVNTTPAPMGGSQVAWGGVNELQRDNYFITEDSEPAKLGSSLGWLLQLDGDNMRNAFLNAPWVKAVIPIRPGKEEAAINWLKGVEGMNGITDDVIYRTSNAAEKDIAGNPLDGQKLIDVIHDLGKKIRRKYEDGIATGKYPKVSEVSDPQLVDEDSTVTATPIDRVYEHGFFPLENSFKANVDGHYEIFDQWIEILPTDQIVPVPVKYDPKTGRQV
jgi:hypothetical protein